MRYFQVIIDRKNSIPYNIAKRTRASDMKSIRCLFDSDWDISMSGQKRALREEEGEITVKKALFLGILGSFFFAFTFVLNRSMNLAGGSWLWSASLRYLFTLPLMFVILIRGRAYRPVMAEIKRRPGPWRVWSLVGFGLFYVPMSLASTYAESWFTAAVWQFTIVAGVLLTPLFGKKIPVRNLLLSCVILCGIAIMQIPRVGQESGENLVIPVALIAVAAFAYPLGNRKMMEICPGDLNTSQRVFGMTLCSMPCWILCAGLAVVQSGPPSGGQLLQSFCVALFSGVIATILFFGATDLVSKNPQQLAVIEATQAGEVLFTLLLGVVFFHDQAPEPVALAGIGLVVLGMIANSLASANPQGAADVSEKR